MKHRSVDMLLARHRLISNFSLVALIVLFVAILILAASGFEVSGRFHDEVERVMGLALGVVMVLSLSSMIGSTFHVVRNRDNLSDWGTFLLVIWLIPYLGVSFILGGSKLLTFIGRAK